MQYLTRWLVAHSNTVTIQLIDQIKDTGLNSQVDTLIKTLVDRSSPLACLLRQEIKILSEVYLSALSDIEDKAKDPIHLQTHVARWKRKVFGVCVGRGAGGRR